MTLPPGPPPDLLAVVAGLALDPGYARHVIAHLTGIGSSALGFRTTGTAEDAAVAAFVAAEMRDMGLSGVEIEDVDVDGWRFTSATVQAGELSGASFAEAGASYQGVSLGGAPPTPASGVTAPLVDVGSGRRRELDRRDVAGAVVLLDWARAAVGPSAIVLELAVRGAVGVVVNCPAGGPWYQTVGALGCFNSDWPVGAPPMMLITKEDAAQLRALHRRRPQRVTMRVDVELVPHARGHNVVGYLHGDRAGPIVVGAHHDAWFQGAFDNTSGVAALLTMARALVTSGHRPRHTICFTSRTAEEYGIAGSAYDWCIGAWRQAQNTHPQWRTEAPFHLCLEASGHRQLRTVVEAPVELAGWARKVCRTAASQGWAPTGWRVAPPVAGTEQWPLLISGIPGIACYAWEKSFGRTDYHTQFDTMDLLDFDVLLAQIRLYALLLLEADQDPDAVLDHSARARQLAGIATATGNTALAAAAERHRAAVGRADFTSVGTSLLALDANAATCYPHEQALRDRGALVAALSALDRDDRTAAHRALRGVGQHGLFPYLGEAAFRTHVQRFEPGAVSRTWAADCHLSPSPLLWPEMASLIGDGAAPAFGPWVRASLVRALAEAEGQLTARLEEMAQSVPMTPASRVR